MTSDSEDEESQTQDGPTLPLSEMSPQPSQEILKFDWTLAGRGKDDSFWHAPQQQKLIQSIVGREETNSVKVPEISELRWYQIVSKNTQTEDEIREISRHYEHPPSWITTCCDYSILDFACSSLTKYRIILPTSRPRLGTIISLPPRKDLISVIDDHVYIMSDLLPRTTSGTAAI
jgi:hypothetical protein